MAPNRFNNPDLIQRSSCCDCCGWLGFVVALPEFQVLGDAFLCMLPAAQKLLKALFVVIFFFSALGAASFKNASIRTGWPI